MGWPPQVGDLLPRAEEAIGVRYKLATYSLVKGHKLGGAKARGFERILGITLESIDYLERAIILGVQETPIVSVRENWPFGLMCVVDCRVRGLGIREAVVAPVRTAWLVSSPSASPRLTSAYIKP